MSSSSSPQSDRPSDLADIVDRLIADAEFESAGPEIPSPTGLQKMTGREVPSPRRRRVFLPIILFAATCASTLFVGGTSWMPIKYLIILWHNLSDSTQLLMVFRAINWDQGLTYMGAVLSILLTHEMGHFLITLRYRIPASYPLFIPLPINALGTMGAVIGMDSMKANRKEMFDLGLSGPLAGLIVAIPVFWIGIERLDLQGPPGEMSFYCPLIGNLMIAHLHPEFGDPSQLAIGIRHLNPFFMAGWVGMLITGLNMLPISQLDGGHVVYALFGKRAHRVARMFLILAILFIIVEQVYMWTLMLVIIIFIGTDHPPTSDDSMPIGPLRWVLGVASLAIPIFCFAPFAIKL